MLVVRQRAEEPSALGWGKPGALAQLQGVIVTVHNPVKEPPPCEDLG